MTLRRKASRRQAFHPERLRIRHRHHSDAGKLHGDREREQRRDGHRAGGSSRSQPAQPENSPISYARLCPNRRRYYDCRLHPRKPERSRPDGDSRHRTQPGFLRRQQLLCLIRPLELRDGDGALLAANNDWQDDPIQAAKLVAAGLAPSHKLESGMAVTLPPGRYTALLAGENNTFGHRFGGGLRPGTIGFGCPAAPLRLGCDRVLKAKLLTQPGSHAWSQYRCRSVRPLKPLPTEELERYGDPPMFIWGTGLSEGLISQHGPFTSYQVNVDANGQNITGDAANEPSISIDPTDRNKMVIGWRQFDSVGSNFRQAGWGFTSNGGVSLTLPRRAREQCFPSDPVLASNDLGHFFLSQPSYQFFRQYVALRRWRPSWTNLAPATGGDKQWFTIDIDQRHRSRVPVSMLEHSLQ